MPKKTKKEKIIAELRRKLETVESTSEKVVTRKEEPGFHPITNYQSPISNIPIAIASPSSIKTESASLILKDLRKTFLLAGLAISLEFIIYWLTELGGSKFFGFLTILKK